MAVMATLKRCLDCGEVFVSDTWNGKYCACCSARRSISTAARKKDCRKLKPDPLTLDVRQADAAGLSYGRWRFEETERRKEEKCRRMAEECKRKRARNKQRRKKEP